MKTFSVTREIKADPATVWALLTDAAGYPQWNTTVVGIKGTIAKDQKISVTAKISPDRAFDVSVVEFEPETKMVWKGGMPLGMLTGIRTHIIDPSEDGVTFSMKEEFTGLMVGVIPDLTEAFNEFGDCLKLAAEAKSNRS